MSNLPVSWINVQLGDVVDYGNTSKAEPTEIAEDSWILELEDIEKTSSKLIQRILFSERQSKSTKNKFEKNDVLYGKLRPYLDKVIIANESGYCTTEIIPIKPGKYLDNRFLFYGLKRKEFIDYVSEVSHGLNMPRLGTRQGQAAPFVLAPLNEQIRIADKLDSVLAKVDAAQARLGKIPTLLKRFRQSVLAAATSGELTREWRDDKKPRPIQDYSSRTTKERENKGIKESKHSKEFSVDKEPFEIPNNWQWVRLGHIALKITDGAHNTPHVLDNGYPYLMAKDLTGGSLDFSENRYISEKAHRELHIKCLPEVGDLLVVNIGAGTGNNVLINVDFEFSFKNIAIIKRPSFVEAEYLKYFFDAQKKRIFDEQTRGGAQPFLSLSVLNDIPFALPSIEEQKEIVRRVESLFTLADTVEKQYLETKKRLDRLTQSLLAKAFRGELVPQDPNDEPAAELLKRIQAERNAQPPVKNKRKQQA